MGRSRPLCEMWFLPGLPQRHVSMFVRPHHTIADASPMTKGSQTLFSTVPHHHP
ncbi:MAG TPA: wax ester/triacylglycerol synthase domain-containing protein [Candidatus Dormibacteraeota bacterium]|nr:wax ester/triacylglycerol synthase domain-containing protein [Candidatus Dormibacteraeota bacterium]